MAAETQEKNPAYCAKHCDEWCTFACLDCSELICDDCVSSNDHSEHDIKSFKNLIKEIDLHELKEFIENHGEAFKSKAEDVEIKFKQAVDSIDLQADNIISGINKIREKKKDECERKRANNSNAMGVVLSVIDSSHILACLEKIEMLPDKHDSGVRAEYADAARAIMNYKKAIDSSDFLSVAPLFIPEFKFGNIQTSQLKKMFGKLLFEKEDVGNLLDLSDISSESDTPSETDTSDSDTTSSDSGATREKTVSSDDSSDEE